MQLKYINQSHFNHLTLSNDKKLDTEIIGHVLEFASFEVSNNQAGLIQILCHSNDLETAVKQWFNYSTKWTHLNLQKGDKVTFKAKIKKTEYVVHKTERWVDEWRALTPDMIDYETVIEIQYPKQIKKI